MRMRPFLAVAMLIAAVPAVHAQEKPAKKETPPALLLQIKSLGGILSDARYLSKFADLEEQFKQGEELAKNFSGNFAGIDLDRPMALYGDFSPGFQDSPVVLLVPIADEKALVDFLSGTLNIEAVKDKDGVYTVDKVPNFPGSVYFRFANKYAYFTVMDKANIAEKKLVKPETVVFPAGEHALASLTMRLDGVPDIIKFAAVSFIEEKLADAKKQAPADETESMKKLRHASIDMVVEKVKSVLNDGEEMTIKLGVDQKKEDLNADFTFKAKKGSALAKDLESLGKTSSLFSSLAGDHAAMRIVGAMALPAELRKLMGPALTDALKDAVAKETDPHKAKAMKLTTDAILPTLLAGELDAGFAAIGPNKEGHFTFIGGSKLVDGKKVESAIAELHGLMDEKDRKNFVLNATKIGDVTVNKIILPEGDENTKKLLGESSLYFAIRNDMILAAAGPDALKAIKETLSATPKSSAPLLKADIAFGRLLALNANDPKAAKMAEEVFGKDPKGTDTASITVEMGEVLKISLKAKAKIIAFGAKSQQQ